MQLAVTEPLRDQFEAIAWRHSDPPDAEWLEFAELLAAHYTPPATGRHSIIGNKEIIARILTFLAQGSWRDTACHRAGTTAVTFNALLKRGEEGETPFNAFLWAVKRAEGVAEDDQVSLVRAAGKDPKFWAAAATWLERKFPDKYARRNEDSAGPRVVVQIGVAPGDVQVSVQGLPEVKQITVGEVIE